MMGAASLPMPQASTPAGFAAFLSTIGQTPTGSGEDGGFEQLLAAAPMPAPAPVKAAPPIAVAGSPAMPTVTAPVALATPVATAVATPSTTIDASAVTAKSAEPGTAIAADPDAAAASAAKLLIAVNGSAPAPQPETARVVEPKPGTDTETASAPETGAGPISTVPAEPAAPVAGTPDPVAAAPAVLAAMPVIAAIIAPVVGKPTKAGELVATATSAATPAPAADLPSATSLASGPRPVAAKPGVPASEPAPITAPVTIMSRPTPPTAPRATAGTEAQPTKPVEAAPSMTIQFAQPAAPGAAITASVAQPMIVTERVLDLASDGAWIDQLAHDIAATKSDSGDISFRLMPRHLGRLDVAMLVGDEGVSLKLDTQNDAAATIVTAAQGRLVEDLRQQGVRVTGSEVTCTPGDNGRQMQGQSQGQGRAAAQDVSHLIETVTERAKARDPEEAADRRGRFA